MGERWLFIGPPRAQATSANFRWPELVAVTDLASARRAVEEILEQGEGARGHWEDAHFGQFVKILDEYQAMRDANPAFEPARPVIAANVRLCELADVPLITDPVTAQCTDLFNVAYEILLQALERYFANTEETDAQLATLADLTLGLMFQVIKPLGDLITTLPAGPQYPRCTAGPSFELFYETDYLMPHRGAAWALLEERLREAADYAERVRADGAPTVREGLTTIGPALAVLADSLAAHFPDWGSTSRWTQVRPTPAADAAAAEVEALVARAVPLGHGGAAGPPASPTSRDTQESEKPAAVPGPDEMLSFDRHIKPLFRARDRQSMSFAFDLWSYADVTANAGAILERLRNGSMPCDGSWPQESVRTFQRWIDTGAAE